MRKITKKKKAQESYGLLSRKSGQEEMVGFGLIIMMIGIIFIVFISIYIRKPTEKINDYEASSFIQSILQYTTTCEEESLENLTIQELIFQCQEKNPCWNMNRNENPCSILNNTIKKIITESWEVKPTTPTKGYSFLINISEGDTEKSFLNITEGVVTNNYRGAEQDFGRAGEYLVILFNVYT